MEVISFRCSYLKVSPCADDILALIEILIGLKAQWKEENKPQKTIFKLLPQGFLQRLK